MKRLLTKPSTKLFLPNPANPSLKRAKKLFLLGLFATWVIMPELLLHKLSLVFHYVAVLLHYIYETLSFLLEEGLMHGLGMEKHYAQMLVFYLFLALACWVLYWLWKRLPQFLQSIKTRLLLSCSHIKYLAIETWDRMTVWQKIKLVLFQLAGVTGGLTLLFL